MLVLPPRQSVNLILPDNRLHAHAFKNNNPLIDQSLPNRELYEVVHLGWCHRLITAGH